MKRIIFILILLFALPLYSITGSEALSKFRARMRSIGSMRGMISMSTEGGMMNGTFSYKSPGKIHVQFDNGKTIVSNGRKLWVYNPESGICGVQDLGGGGSGGIASLIDGYTAMAREGGSGAVIKLTGSGYYDDITIITDGSYMLRSATFNNSSGGGFSVNLSGVQLNLGLPGGMFDYSVPANAQLVNNPLNIQ
ncbi:MAG: outer membrane lipoprotein carrier protein LolA [Spirochaetes bacterium]|nr:outer membrane lipoprotein carrier protein LolA [Spirochaetota bacterium]MBN2770947.1 outer membrane lipoprotein carrier protein LolA [Spirochaetota bacterium]